MVVKRVAAEYASDCAKADLPCTFHVPISVYVMDNAFLTNLYYIKYSKQLKGLCHQDIVVLCQFHAEA